MNAGQAKTGAEHGMFSRCTFAAMRTLVCAVALSGLAVLMPDSSATAQGVDGAVPTTIDARVIDGHGRMIITFEKDVPKFEASATIGVLVLQFDEPLAPNVEDIEDSIGAYITAGRRDPDGRAIRFALAQPVTVNTMEAGEKLFVDLLPENWVGMPPGLPQEVVAELARRAEEAEKRRREREMLEAFRNSTPVDVRITSLPTFSRFVFVFEEAPDARIDRGIETATVLFDRAAKIDLKGLKSRLPSYVQDIDARLGDGGLEVALTVDPASPVRGFKEDNSFVVDVTAPGSVDAGAAVFGPIGGEDLDGDGTRDTVDTRPDAMPPKPDTLVEFDTEAEIRFSDDEKVPDVPAVQTPAVVEEPVIEEVDFGGAEPVRPEARRTASTVKLTLPFREPTAAAVFERGDALWAVFQSPQPIDARLLRKDLEGYVSAVEAWQSGKATVLRLALAKPLLSKVSGQDTTWFITLGDVALEPGKPLSVSRSLDEAGMAQATIEFPTADDVLDVGNPDGSERLYVVTAPPPTRSLPKPFNFVEFQALRTVHGVAIVPIADQLTVALEGEDVLISRDNGLVMSEVNSTYTPGYSAQFDDRRPGFVRGFDDSSIDPGAVYQLLAGHIRETALADESYRTEARLQMSRALLGTDLGAEALAQLDLIEQEDPGALRDPSVRALRGIAMVMMHRPDEAVREFDAFGLSQSSDIALWRGMAEAQRGNWQAAGAAFKKGMAAISSYSPARRKAFRVAAAEAAIEANDIAVAAVRLAELGESENHNQPEPEVALLNARLAAAMGQKDDAILGFEKVMESGDRHLAAEAHLRHAETLYAARGDIVSDEVVEELERLALSWRGDEIELGALRLLANLQVDRGDYYRAFEIMKSATLSDTSSPTTRALQEDMNRAFEGLFLGGKADELPAVDALALYYDFRELTPLGRKGDEIIRRLADRMVEVDLLEQAGELLRHQVENRLHGAERAQVAAKLAWVYLMNRKPAEAIVVLSRTRQAVLPRAVAYQRLLLEARALSETGRLELALDLLSSADGPEVAQIRAEALWRGERWQDAGEAFERGLDTAWDGSEPLSAGERTRVLRAAISYALAKDDLGLQRIRTKYLTKMAESADAHAFDVVTLPVPDNVSEFGDLVARVAAVDTLDAFLNEYKHKYILTPEENEKVASNT